MSSAPLFRSHLMQQFVTTARAQSRPPIALSRVSARRQSSQRNSLTTSASSSCHEFSRAAPVKLSMSMSSCQGQTTTSKLTGQQSCSDSAVISRQLKVGDAMVKNQKQLDPSLPSLALEQQTVHVTTKENETSTTTEISDNITSRVHQATAPSPDTRSLRLGGQSALAYKLALNRAIASNPPATNHRSIATCPFYITSILRKETIERLADIAANVSLRRKLERKMDASKAYDFANQKRAKWEQVPAFFVTVARDQPLQVGLEAISNNDNDDDAEAFYKELSFTPPETECQMEDYADASSFVHNMVASLRSDQIGTKRVTGPILKTLALRNLLQLTPTDRVVALVMLGVTASSKSQRSSKPSQQTVAVQEL